MRSQERFLHPLAQSQEHGGDTKRLAHLELNRATEGHQPNSRTSMCYFVLGRTGGALQKPCKMTSSMLLVYMFLTKVLETDSMRVAWGVIIFLWKKPASVPGIKKLWLLQLLCCCNYQHNSQPLDLDWLNGRNEYFSCFVYKMGCQVLKIGTECLVSFWFLVLQMWFGQCSKSTEGQPYIQSSNLSIFL